MPGYNRAWSLRTVLPLLKRATEAGDRGMFLTVYEVQTESVEKLLAERSKRIAAAVQAAPAPFGPIVKGMGTISELLARTLVMFCAFIPFFAFRETARVLGEGKLYQLFFRGRSGTESWSPPDMPGELG